MIRMSVQNDGYAIKGINVDQFRMLIKILNEPQEATQLNQNDEKILNELRKELKVAYDRLR